MLLAGPVVFLDLETTGATATSDRITEIGLIEVNHGRQVGEWSTLLNPRTRIPPFIESLTGISNEMVALAPTFEEIAHELKERIDGKLLIAHNARFDYGFLKNEFQRIDMRFRSDPVCTVKLSRKLYPGHAKHNLDALMARHGVRCDARHRALGDARVLWDLIRIWHGELGPDALEKAVAAQLKAPALPPGLPEHMLAGVPEAPGVYLFYGENDLPIYVGKSVNLRSRVLSHFSGDHRVSKDMQIAQQVRRIDWRETCGELGALLEEARLVKALMPTLNRQLRRNQEMCTYTWNPEQPGPPHLIEVGEADFSRNDTLYGVFRSKRAATETLRHLAQAFELCLIATGLEKSASGPCFAHQIKRCRGVCVGAESETRHRIRMMEALGELKLASWPYPGRIGVRESRGGRSELHVIEHWCYLGALRCEQDLDGLARSPRFDLDTYRILKRYLDSPRHGMDIVRMDK